MVGLGLELTTLHMAGKCSAVELQPGPAVTALNLIFLLSHWTYYLEGWAGSLPYPVFILSELQSCSSGILSELEHGLIFLNHF